jgi:hypothetical protein
VQAQRELVSEGTGDVQKRPRQGPRSSLVKAVGGVGELEAALSERGQVPIQWDDFPVNRQRARGLPWVRNQGRQLGDEIYEARVLDSEVRQTLGFDEDFGA